MPHFPPPPTQSYIHQSQGGTTQQSDDGPVGDGVRDVFFPAGTGGMDTFEFADDDGGKDTGDTVLDLGTGGSYDNLVGFYEVEDIDGEIDTQGTGDFDFM